MNILVIGPHPDDQEIGMGGTIARLADQGHNVLLLDVTDGSPTPRGDRASRLAEAAAALAALQPPEPDRPRIRRLLLDLRNRYVEHTIAARHAFAGVIRAHQASVLFVPHWEDAHPDHRAVTRIAEDARFDAKLTKIEMPVPPGYEREGIGPPIYPRWVFYYDVSHLRRVAQPQFCFDITGYERAKQASIRAYRTQFGPWEDGGAGSSGGVGFSPGDPKAPPIDPGRLVSADFPDRVLAYGSFWGSRIGVAFAEPFFTKEPVGMLSLGSLPA